MRFKVDPVPNARQSGPSTSARRAKALPAGSTALRSKGGPSDHSEHDEIMDLYQDDDIPYCSDGGGSDIGSYTP